jgi:predicted dithiol-disulfide oxidoreductase (DUF899 family)
LDANAHEVVGREEWLRARTALLAEEKELTHLRDAVSRKRRELPWERVDAEYAFETPRGRQTLAELFDGRGQLVVYHFMFPSDDDAGCKHCSFWADSFDPNVVHLAARDVTFVAVSRAPLAQLERYRERMGWTFTWVSSNDGDFTYDFGASFREDEFDEPVFNFGTLAPGRADREGVSVFAKGDDGAIYRTYSTHGRGIDILNTAYNYLDLVPQGRGEDGKPPQFWLQRHDEYGT